MKTMKKLMLTIMMVMISTLVIANDNEPTVKVENVKAKSLAVIAYDLGGVKTDIQLRSATGKVYYTETVKSGQNFGKRLELSSVPNGEYTLEVENAESYTAIPVVLNTDSAQAKIADKVTIVKPQVSVIGDKMNVFVDEKQSEEVWVSIYDVNANRLAIRKISNDKGVRFDLSKLDAGNYTVHMSTRGKKFVQSLSLDK